MKFFILIGLLIPFTTFAQTDNKIEGIIINTPCELEYTRNIGNQNNYSCATQDKNEKIFQYSVTVQNLFEEMKGLSGDSLKAFKEQFFKTAKENAKLNNEQSELIVLANGQKALKIKSYLTYSEHKFVNTSILLLYKQKSFVINLTTNDLSTYASSKLSDRIKIK